MSGNAIRDVFTHLQSWKNAKSSIVLLRILRNSVLFVQKRRLGERVRLRLFFFLLGVVADRRWLDWVVARIALLEAMTNIDASELSALGNGDGAGPPERFKHVDSVASCLTLGSISVLLSVTDDLTEPGGLLSREHCVLANITEALSSWVRTLESFQGCRYVVLGQASWGQVRASASLENYRVEVCPCLDVFKLIGFRDSKLFGICHLGTLFVHGEKTLGNEGSSVENARKSRSKKVALLATEGRVGIDISVEVTGEDVLDSTRLVDVLWAAVRKLNPVLKQVGSHPEDGLVDTLSAGFHCSIL